MEYFIGIVPPKYLSDQINNPRVKWNYNATEPHITVKGPKGLNNDWINKVKEVTRNYKVFNISVGGIGFFSDSVLFYKVFSNKIYDLHKRLVEAVPSPTDEEIKNEFELDQYVPHLTIMKHKKGYIDLPLDQIALESAKMLNGKFIFKVHSLRIYGRNNKRENFERIIDLPLYSKNAPL